MKIERNLNAARKQVVIAVFLFAPIWFEPIRTAPTDLHIAVIGLALLGAAIMYTWFRQLLRVGIRALLMDFIGIGIGAMGCGWLFWDLPTLSNLSSEMKLTALYFLAAVTWWFNLTHRDPDGLRTKYF